MRAQKRHNGCFWVSWLDELLEKAFEWIANQDTTDSNSSIATSEAFIGLEGSSLKSSLGSHHGVVPGDMVRSLQVGRVLIPPQGGVTHGIEHSSYPSSPRAQMRTTVNGVTNRVKTNPQFHMSNSKSLRLSGSPPSSTRGSPPSASPSSQTSSTYGGVSNLDGFKPPPKKVPVSGSHRQKLKAALASYFTSFSRDKPLKDILVSKMKESAKNAGDASDYSTKDDADDERSIDEDYLPNTLLDKPTKRKHPKQRAATIDI